MHLVFLGTQVVGKQVKQKDSRESRQKRARSWKFWRAALTNWKAFANEHWLEKKRTSRGRRRRKKKKRGIAV